MDPGFHTFSEGYSLGMVKMEAFDDPHFMHQTVRGGHTDHTGSIVSLMACILKKLIFMKLDTRTDIALVR